MSGRWGTSSPESFEVLFYEYPLYYPHHTLQKNKNKTNKQKARIFFSTHKARRQWELDMFLNANKYLNKRKLKKKKKHCCLYSGGVETGVTEAMSNQGPHEYLSSSLKSRTDIRWCLVLLLLNEVVLFICVKWGLVWCCQVWKTPGCNLHLPSFL